MVGLTYSQFYDQESQLQPGEKRKLELTVSEIPVYPSFAHLTLEYRWESGLRAEEAKNLVLRAIAYITCAIYDAARLAGLSCQLSPISNGRRPAWVLEGEISPVSLVLSQLDEAHCTCQMTIGGVVMLTGEPPTDRLRWERLRKAFEESYHTILV